MRLTALPPWAPTALEAQNYRLDANDEKTQWIHILLAGEELRLSILQMERVGFVFLKFFKNSF